MPLQQWQKIQKMLWKTKMNTYKPPIHPNPSKQYTRTINQTKTE